jgi:hypothetical protein
LEHDGHELWQGFDSYLDYLLSELLGTVPGILVELHKRASEQAKTPLVISQPNSPSAKVNFFIRWLSDYFIKSYGQPLHTHVAAVTNVLLGSDVDEDRGGKGRVGNMGCFLTFPPLRWLTLARILWSI